MARQSDLPPDADPVEQQRRTTERAIASVSKTPEERRRNRRVTSHLSPKTNHALDLMAFEGFTDEEAAARVGMRVYELRRALNEPVVSAALAERAKAFRSGQSLRAWHRLAAIADDEEQPVNARISANRVLLSDERARTAATTSKATNVQVNVGVAVGAGQVIRPGIEIDLSQPDPRELLTQERDVRTSKVQPLRLIDNDRF